MKGGCCGHKRLGGAAKKGTGMLHAGRYEPSHFVTHVYKIPPVCLLLSGKVHGERRPLLQKLQKAMEGRACEQVAWF